MTKIKFNTNSKIKCICGHKLRITELKKDGVEFEKFCPQCGRTTFVDEDNKEKGGKFVPYGAAHFLYEQNEEKNFSGTIEREHDLKGLKGYCHYQYEHGESFYLVISRVKSDGTTEIIKKDYTRPERLDK